MIYHSTLSDDYLYSLIADFARKTKQKTKTTEYKIPPRFSNVGSKERIIGLNLAKID